MTAPSAPTIRGRTNGTVVRLLWQPVLNATDYKVYVGSTTNPSGLEADVADDGDGLGPWMAYEFIPDDIDAYIAVTALNAGLEESAHSNELRIGTGGDGRRLDGPYRSPFG